MKNVKKALLIIILHATSVSISLVAMEVDFLPVTQEPEHDLSVDIKNLLIVDHPETHKRKDGPEVVDEDFIRSFKRMRFGDSKPIPQLPSSHRSKKVNRCKKNLTPPFEHSQSRVKQTQPTYQQSDYTTIFLPTSEPEETKEYSLMHITIQDPLSHQFFEEQPLMLAPWDRREISEIAIVQETEIIEEEKNKQDDDIIEIPNSNSTDEKMINEINEICLGDLINAYQDAITRFDKTQINRIKEKKIRKLNQDVIFKDWVNQNLESIKALAIEEALRFMKKKKLQICHKHEVTIQALEYYLMRHPEEQLAQAELSFMKSIKEILDEEPIKSVSSYTRYFPIWVTRCFGRCFKRLFKFTNKNR